MMHRLIMIAIFWTFIVSATTLFGGSLALGLCLATGIQIALQLFA